MTNYPRQVVLEPRPLWWEAKGVFNPATVEWQGRVHLLYRALGEDHISRLGLAVSADGESFQRLDLPVLEGDENDPLERLGIEDPRAVAIDRTIYITYTAASVYPVGYQGPSAASLNTPGVPWRVRVCAFKTTDLRRFTRLGVLLPEVNSKNGVLFPERIQGRFWLLHRINPSIYLASSPNLRHWQGSLQLVGPRPGWEELKVGAACPPIATEKGWLLLYHGVDKQRIYRVGAALLDQSNPAVVLQRTTRPILEPSQAWEKRGQVPNVIFPTGFFLKDGRLWLYYGGADRVVGLIKIPLEDLLSNFTS